MTNDAANQLLLDSILVEFRGPTPRSDTWGVIIDEPHVRGYLLGHWRRFDLLTRTVRRLRPPCAKVLEVGAAYGATLLMLKSAGYDVYATDMSEGIAAYGAPLLSARIETRPWDLHRGKCPFQESSFDVVIASEVLEHLQVSLRSAVALLSTALKPGGVLLVTVPNLYSSGKVRRILVGENICEPFPDTPILKGGIVVDDRCHPREPTMREILRAFSDNGIRVVKKHCCSMSPSLWKRVAHHVLLNRFGECLLVAGEKAPSEIHLGGQS